MQHTFHTDKEHITMPLSYSMTEGITCCTVNPEVSAFMALHNAFSFRWTGARNTEYGSDDMRRATHNALASSTDVETPLLAVMILRIWEDISRSSVSI